MTDLHILSDQEVAQFIFIFIIIIFFYCYQIFLMFGLIGSIKTFAKVPGVGMNVGPYVAYILYI